MSDQTKQPDLAERIADKVDEAHFKAHINALTPSAAQKVIADAVRQTLRSDPTLKAVEEALNYAYQNTSTVGYDLGIPRLAHVCKEALTALRQLRGEEV